MRKLTLIMLILFISMTANSWATTTYGTWYINYNTGIFATPDWNNENTVLSMYADDWSNPGYWTYQYTFTVTGRGISHLILQVSENFLYKSISGDFSKPTTYSGSDPSNPGMPHPIYGIKWDNPSSSSWSLTIVSPNVPVWANFYAVDGKGQYPTYAYNTEFAGANWNNPPKFTGTQINGWVLAPDTAMIPEPGTLLLLGTGLLGIAAIRYRRSKQ